MIMPEKPIVSVVVPTYRRPALLKRCLEAVARQSIAPQLYEIIVCDDGPDIQTETAVRQAAQSTAAQLRYIPVTQTQGPAGARNQGWQAATGEIIAFTDDDTEPDPAWLEAGLAAMADGAHAATGSIRMPLPEQPSDYEVDAARLTSAEFVTANCFIRRDVLGAVQGFDERFRMAWREDSDMHFTLLERGYRIVTAPEAVVVHPLRAARFAASLGMQKKIMFDVLLYRKHPHLYRQRIRHGPPWFYLLVSALLLCTVLALTLAQWQLAAVALTGWIVATLVFFIRRLATSAFTLHNVLELGVTSVMIPPLSIYWRMVGVARYGARFP